MSPFFSLHLRKQVCHQPGSPLWGRTPRPQASLHPLLFLCPSEHHTIRSAWLRGVECYVLTFGKTHPQETGAGRPCPHGEMSLAEYLLSRTFSTVTAPLHRWEDRGPGNSDHRLQTRVTDWDLHPGLPASFLTACPQATYLLFWASIPPSTRWG